MVIHYPSGIESAWLRAFRRSTVTALGAVSVAAGFHVSAHAEERVCAGDPPRHVGRTVDAGQLRLIRAGSAVLNVPYAAQLAVILWDEARPPAPPVRNAGAVHTQTVTASMQVVTK